MKEDRYFDLVERMKKTKITKNQIYAEFGISPYLFKKYLKRMEEEGYKIKVETYPDGRKYFWIESEKED